MNDKYTAYTVNEDGWSPELQAWVYRDNRGNLVTIPADDDEADALNSYYSIPIIDAKDL